MTRQGLIDPKVSATKSRQADSMYIISHERHHAITTSNTLTRSAVTPALFTPWLLVFGGDEANSPVVLKSKLPQPSRYKELH